MNDAAHFALRSLALSIANAFPIDLQQSRIHALAGHLSKHRFHSRIYLFFDNIFRHVEAIPVDKRFDGAVAQLAFGLLSSIAFESRSNVGSQFVHCLELFAHSASEVVIQFWKLFGSDGGDFSGVVNGPAGKFFGLVVRRIRDRERSLVSRLNAGKRFGEFLENAVGAKLDVQLILLDFVFGRLSRFGVRALNSPR